VVAIKEEKAVNTPSRSSRATQEPAETPTPIQVIQGVLKAKDIYKAGIKCYQEKEYEKAIAYLQKAVAYDDPYTPKYVIAEAYATLGVIYQFYFPVEGNLKIAADNYKKALRYEPTNPTALKYLRKLKPLSK
jgi:tetratricopeptide (TPR) repeat protein